MFILHIHLNALLWSNNYVTQKSMFIIDVCLRGTHIKNIYKS